MAGPRIAFDPEIACAAAEFLRQASWALVNHDDRVTDLVKRLKMPGSPLTPSHHLSADLTLRYLPQVLRRARGLDPSDPLVAQLANVLRTGRSRESSPTSSEAPLVPLRFRRASRAHALVCRASDRQRSTVLAADTNGPSWDYYELVLQEHGQSRPGRRRKRGSWWMTRSLASAAKSSSRSRSASWAATRSST